MNDNTRAYNDGSAIKKFLLSMKDVIKDLDIKIF